MTRRVICWFLDQSNGGGRESGIRLRYTNVSPTPNNVFVYWKPAQSDPTDNGSWIALAPNKSVEPDLVNNPANFVGLQHFIGDKIAKITKEPVYIISRASGGNSLAGHLVNGSIDDSLDNYFTPAITKLQAQFPGDTIEVLGIYSMVGENDAASGGTAVTNYTTNFDTARTQIRNHDPLLATCPFIWTQIWYQQTANETTINNAMSAKAALESDLYYIQTDDTDRIIDMNARERGPGAIASVVNDHHSYLRYKVIAERTIDILLP